MNEEAKQEVIVENPGGTEKSGEPEGPTPEQVQAAVDKKATDTGWQPEKEFKGDPKAWRPAEEWNKRGDELIPFIKIALKDKTAENETLKGEVATLKKKNESTEDTLQRIIKTQDAFGENQYASNIADLEVQELEAFDEGDKERFREIREEKAKIIKPEVLIPKEPDLETKATPEETEADFQRWVKDNQWFNDDPALKRAAIGAANELESNGVKINTYDFFEQAGAQVKKDFAERFTNPNQDKSNVDESSLRGGESVSDNGSKGYSDLPQAAKAVCNKMIANPRMNMTKEKYAAEYYKGDEG